MNVPGMDGSDVNADINMTPMIDVMLVLLIIFMVITPALAGYAVTLPRSSEAEPEKDDRVTLAVDAEGRYYLEGRPGPLSAGDLPGVLAAAYASRPDDHVLYLKADRGVSYAAILTAVDAAREVGVARIGAITDQARESREARR